MKTNVAVVVPNWNGKEFIGRGLKSLETQSVRTQIIVVDNGSTDGSSGYITEQFPAVDLIKLNTNTGFTGGVNTGITKAITDGCKYVLLFNSDAVASVDWIQQLVYAAEKHPKAGIITGKFMRADKKHIDSTGDMLSTRGLPFPRGRNEVDSGQYDSGEYIFGASGGASLYRVSMLNKIGLFDEDFFAYYEDGDISFRAQSAGWKVYYEPNAVAYHEVGATSKKMGTFSRYHSVKNIILLYTRNMPGKLYWKYMLPFSSQLARMFMGALRDGALGSYSHGLWSALVLLPRTLVVRHKNKTLRKLTSSEIDKLLYHGRPPRPPIIKDGA